MPEDASTSKKHRPVHIYDPKKSLTGRHAKEKEAFNTKYASETVVGGRVFTDTITVGGLHVNNQWFSAVRVTEGKPVVIDGLLGLGTQDPNHQSKTDKSNFIDNLLSQQRITHRIFSLYFTSGSGSELYIGGINKDKYEGQITYLPQIGHTWTVIGSTSLNGEVKYTGPMLIDSGSSYIYGSKDSVWEWWGKIKGAEPCGVEECKGTGFFKFPCDTPISTHFTFNGHEFPFTRDDLILSRLSNQIYMCAGAITVDNSLQDGWFWELSL
ncbi:aspartyl protease [Rhizoctonia solani AG-3 Rhs1AP]|uniref:Aspartyl protease n=1 Tax=Rhizoctonia solani AG-3 Rhs1AP TaxID=1086054 RepID=A0A0A1UKG7_9AGAM|nr:aspartyl protease [Rhizoctonia solani AG-3 Rhs1AP]